MPRDTAVLWPVMALVAWTYAMLLLLAYRRLRAGLAGQVHAREFALGESDKVPVPLVLANRNYMNLLELPVLFYVGSLVLWTAGTATALQLAMAWAYVLLRVVHSLIHVTRNRVMHRFFAFLCSNIVLASLWVSIAVQMA